MAVAAELRVIYSLTCPPDLVGLDNERSVGVKETWVATSFGRHDEGANTERSGLVIEL